MENVTITLSKQDAEVIATVTRHIGGHPNGPRGAVDRLALILYDAGIIPKCEYKSKESIVSDTITFTDSWTTFKQSPYLTDFDLNDSASHIRKQQTKKES